MQPRPKLDLNKVHDLTHRLWYQVTMALTDTPGRGAPGPACSGEVGIISGTISALKEVIPLLEKHREEILRNGPSGSA